MSRIVSIVIALLWASSAHATPLGFRGEIGVVLPTIGVIVSVPGAGTAAVESDASGLLTRLSLPAGVFATSASFPGSALLRGISIGAQNGAGVFSSLTANGGGGVMPFLGVARLCLLAPCSSETLFRDLALTPIGSGGVAHVTGALAITLEGARWTKGVFTITAPGLVSQIGGFARGPAGLTGSTAQPGGELILATPIYIRTSLPGLGEIPGFAMLSLSFVPEPGTIALLGVGIAGLGCVGSRRRNVRWR